MSSEATDTLPPRNSQPDPLPPDVVEASKPTNPLDTFVPPPKTKDTAPVPLPLGAMPMSAPTAANLGYRETSEKEQALIKTIRARGEDMRQLVEQLNGAHADKRWVAIAATHFQEGCMAAVRAVAKPAFF